MNNVGLFSRLANGATLTGIILVDSRITGRHDVGSLVGRSVEGVIEGCSATGSVVGGGDTVGGLVGFSSGFISDSYATGSVVGRGGSVGGLAGAGSNIRNSYATGSVPVEDRVGGLVGTIVAGGISNSYATGSVFGQERVGGLAGQVEVNANIANSYYAARWQNNDFGTERTFTQLRCPTKCSATCSLSGSGQMTYEDWDTSVWDFGSATDLPQLSSNRNSELNLKPYINGSADLVVVTGFTGTTQFSLVADYLGSSGEFVILTWSLSDVPTMLRHLVYFDLGDGTTSTTVTDIAKLTDSASPVTLVVVGNKGLASISFYVVLKNDISAKDDRVRVDVEEEKQPYILQSDDIRIQRR